MTPTRILYIAYPLITVSEHSAGGAEQMLWTIEHEIAARGIHTTVAASAGSSVRGELFVTGEACSIPDDFERRNREHQDRIVEFIRKRAREGRGFDLIHDQSGSFWPRASEIDVPVLATLHLPRSFYASELFHDIPANVVFNCVSQSQARTFVDLNPVIVPNGILLDHFTPTLNDKKRLLWLGRICEEKAPHIALDMSQSAGEPIALAGQVYPFSYHQKYFEREVLPRLAQMPNAIFIDSPSAEHKRQLLREAKAVLITSQADETSSLVAMEAAASGTPVIAFRRGALPEVVKDGVTGFLVDNMEEAVAALQHVDHITPSACIAHVQENFSSRRMANDYEHLYSHLMQTINQAAQAIEAA
jgi:glycosyltransferase involved in cell wall biosynthesis